MQIQNFDDQTEAKNKESLFKTANNGTYVLNKAELTQISKKTQKNEDEIFVFFQIFITLASLGAKWRRVTGPSVCGKSLTLSLL